MKRILETREDVCKRACLSPREELEQIVEKLVLEKFSFDFPRKCATAFEQVVFPLIAEHSKGSFVLPQQTKVGKNLGMIARIAVLVKRDGDSSLHALRKKIDNDRSLARREPTRHWFALRNENLLKEIDLSCWSSFQREWKLASMTEDVMNCFKQHEPTATTSIELAKDDQTYELGFECDACHDLVEFGDNLFVHCQVCNLDFCFGCDGYRMKSEN